MASDLPPVQGSPDPVSRNPYRVLGLPGDARNEEIAAAATRLLAEAEAVATPWDLTWLGPPPRERADVERALARLRDPRHRLRDRLLWFHERVAEGAVADLRPASLQDAVEGWSATSEPLARHDAAVVAWLAAIHLAPDGQEPHLWRRALSEWRAALALDAYWMDVLRLEMEGGFDQPASLDDIRDLQERALALVAEPVVDAARRGIIEERLERAARALAVLRESLPEDRFRDLCGDLAWHVEGIETPGADVGSAPEAGTGTPAVETGTPADGTGTGERPAPDPAPPRDPPAGPGGDERQAPTPLDIQPSTLWDLMEDTELDPGAAPDASSTGHDREPLLPWAKRFVEPASTGEGGTDPPSAPGARVDSPAGPPDAIDGPIESSAPDPGALDEGSVDEDPTRERREAAGDGTATRESPPDDVPADLDARGPDPEPAEIRPVETSPAEEAPSVPPEPAPSRRARAPRGDRRLPLVGALAIAAAMASVLVFVTLPQGRGGVGTPNVHASDELLAIERQMERNEAALAEALVERHLLDVELRLLAEAVRGYRTLVQDYERRMERRLPADPRAYDRVVRQHAEMAERRDAAEAERDALDAWIESLERRDDRLVGTYNATQRSGGVTTRDPSP